MPPVQRTAVPARPGLAADGHHRRRVAHRQVLEPARKVAAEQAGDAALDAHVIAVRADLQRPDEGLDRLVEAPGIPQRQGKVVGDLRRAGLARRRLLQERDGIVGIAQGTERIAEVRQRRRMARPQAEGTPEAGDRRRRAARGAQRHAQIVIGLDQVRAAGDGPAIGVDRLLGAARALQVDAGGQQDLRLGGGVDSALRRLPLHARASLGDQAPTARREPPDSGLRR